MNDANEAETPDGGQDPKPELSKTQLVWFLLVLGTLVSAFGFPSVLLLLLPLAFSATVMEPPK